MIKDQYKIDITGNWEAYIQTPFGEAKAIALIKEDDVTISGTINGENGSFDFDNGTIIENTFVFSATIDTPIKATISVSAEIEDYTFKGKLMIDEYLTMNILGKKNVNI
jgi:hypothetical protein